MSDECPEILYQSFNQDLTYFLIGTKEGCTIYKTEPYRYGFKLSIKGIFSMVKMLNSSNIFVIVGSLKNQNLSNEEVLVWDEKIKKKIYQFSIKKQVLNLELTSDKIIVVCEFIIYIFSTKNFQLIDIIKTGKNIDGLIAVSYKETNILVYPSIGKEYGKLTIKNYDTQSYLYLNPTDGEVSNITLSYNGLFLATVIKKDGLDNKIKIFLAKTGMYLDEFTREEKEDNILCTSFSKDNNFFSISLSKGIIPVWSLKKAKILIGQGNEIGIASNIHGFNWIFSPSTNEKPPNIVHLKDNPNYVDVKLGLSNKLYIITSNGKYSIIEFDGSKKIKKKEEEFKPIEENKDLFPNNN